MALNPADGYPHTPEYYAKFAGNEERQSFQFVKDIDTAMRANYAANIVNIGQNIYPLLYVESTFDGGRYTLLTDSNTRYVHQNVGQIYDVMKAFSHIPLGIFSIISGYGEYSAFGQWVPALQAYREQIYKAGSITDHMDDLTSDDKLNIDALVAASLDHIDTIIQAGSFSYAEFANYAHRLNFTISQFQKRAARNQFEVMTAVLTNWKAMMEDDWDKMYVIISAIWTLTQENAHELIIKALMKPDLRETHVVVSEAVPNLEAAQTLMGRIVGDRIMSELVFQSSPVSYAEDIYSLSTRRDLLSQAVEAAISDGAKAGGPATDAATCPHLRS